MKRIIVSLSPTNKRQQCSSLFGSLSSRRALTPVQFSPVLNTRIYLIHIKWAKIAEMKKPTLRIEEQRPRNIQRADIVPSSGYAIVVDGHFKTQFSEENAARKAATELLA